MKILTALLATLLAAALLGACGNPDNSSEAGGGSGDSGSSVPGSGPEDPDSPTSDDPYSRDKDCGEVTGGQGDDPDEPVMQKPCPNQTPPGGAKFELVAPYDGPIEGGRPVPWERSRARGSDDRTFLLIYWSGVEPCNVLDRVEVDEGADRVVATIYEGAAADQQNVACIDIALQKAVEITLDEPLGDRELVDGATDQS